MNNQFYESNVATVDYQIIFTKRDYEAVLEKNTVTVTKAMSGSGFASWKIAEFIQKLNKGGAPTPAEWVDKKPKDLKEIGDIDKTNITSLKRDSLEYLQVEYQVLSTLERKPAKHDQDQVDALKDIAEQMSPKALTVSALPLSDPKIPGQLWYDQNAGKIEVSK